MHRIIPALFTIFVPIAVTPPAPLVTPIIGEPACHSTLPCSLYWQEIETRFWSKTYKSLTCDDTILHDMPTVLRTEIMLDCEEIKDDSDVLMWVNAYWFAVEQGDGCANDIAHPDHMPEELASTLRERCYHYQDE